jgi:ankyrin repeat protein
MRDNLSDIEDLVSVCAGLVTVEQESNIVRLVHYTTQEYLESILPERCPEAQQNITITCLTYLLFNVFKDGFCLSDEIFENRLQQHHLFDYASRYWWIYPLEHKKPYVRGLALKFLMDDSRVAGSMQVILSVRGYRRFPQSAPWQFSGLHLVAYLGVIFLVMLLLEKGVKLETKDDQYRQTALLWATMGGREAVVALLLEQGAELESRDRREQTLLSRAAMLGHEPVVALLLEQGAELESKDSRGQTPLSWAASRGHEAVVALLLKKGAEIESKDSRGQTPLSQAAMCRREAVIALLLKKGAELESKDSSGQTPLS